MIATVLGHVEVQKKSGRTLHKIGVLSAIVGYWGFNTLFKLRIVFINT